MQAHQLEHMQKHLNLTADQTTQVKAIFADTDTQMASLHQDASIPREQKWAKMKSIHEASQTKIRSILTDDQKPKFDAMIAHEHERMEEHGGRQHGEAGAPLPPPPPPA
jgi:Spy/CpxP family protein refolding chaperone